MRLIDAATAAEIISNKVGVPLVELVDAFADVPTVDAVEVVRCKDCIYFDDDVYMYCLYHKGMVMTRKDTYCSWGQRKDEVIKNDHA